MERIGATCSNYGTLLPYHTVFIEFDAKTQNHFAFVQRISGDSVNVWRCRDILSIRKWHELMHLEKNIMYALLDDASSYRVNDDRFSEWFWLLSCTLNNKYFACTLNASEIHGRVLLFPKMMVMMPFTNNNPNEPIGKKTGRSKLPIIQTWKMYCNSYFTCIVCICLWFNICNFMRSQRRFQSSWSLNILNGFGIPFVDTVTQYHWILFKMRVLAAAPSIYFMQFANTSLLCKLLVALARKQIA